MARPGYPAPNATLNESVKDDSVNGKYSSWNSSSCDSELEVEWHIDRLMPHQFFSILRIASPACVCFILRPAPDTDLTENWQGSCAACRIRWGEHQGAYASPSVALPRLTALWAHAVAQNSPGAVAAPSSRSSTTRQRPSRAMFAHTSRHHHGRRGRHQSV